MPDQCLCDCGQLTVQGCSYAGADERERSKHRVANARKQEQLQNKQRKAEVAALAHLQLPSIDAAEPAAVAQQLGAALQDVSAAGVVLGALAARLDAAEVDRRIHAATQELAERGERDALQITRLEERLARCEEVRLAAERLAGAADADANALAVRLAGCEQLLETTRLEQQTALEALAAAQVEVERLRIVTASQAAALHAGLAANTQHQEVLLAGLRPPQPPEPSSETT